MGMGMGIKFKKASKPFGLDALVTIVESKTFRESLQDALFQVQDFAFFEPYILAKAPDFGSFIARE